MNDTHFEPFPKNTRIHMLAQDILPAMITSYTRENVNTNYWGAAIMAVEVAETMINELDKKFPLP